MINLIKEEWKKITSASLTGSDLLKEAEFEREGLEDIADDYRLLGIGLTGDGVRIRMRFMQMRV